MNATPAKNPTTLAELYDQLEGHDWFHCMSDDSSVFGRGAAESARLVSVAASIEGGADLLVAFRQFAFGGTPFCPEKHPKPERPKS